MSDEYGAAPQSIEWNGMSGTVRYQTDANLIVFFYTKPLHNVPKSTEAGRPVYEDTIFVKMHPPGERLNIIDRPSTVADQRRFPMQWNQFKENRSQIPDGTPIDMLYPDHPSIAATLRACAVHTIEQCANLSSNAIENIGMGAQRYVNDAIKYLEMANKGVGASQFRKEMEQRDQEIGTLKRQIEMLQGQIDMVTKNPNAGGVNLSDLQAFIASKQGRPTFPGNGAPVAPQFDAQAAMINDTHPTKDVVTKSVKPKAQQKKQRARIAG